MAPKEKIHAFFESDAGQRKNIAEGREVAFREKYLASVAYLKGELTLNGYKQVLDRLFPLTKMNFDKIAQELQKK